MPALRLRPPPAPPATAERDGQYGPLVAAGYPNGCVSLRAADLRRRHGYSERDERVVTAAARPPVFWIGEDPATQQRVRGWPVGPALLEMLGALNSEVRTALAAERARLRRHGYADDLPLPALWWAPRLRAI